MQQIASQFDGLFNFAYWVTGLCFANLFLHPGLESSLTLVAAFALTAWKWRISPASRKATHSEVETLKEEITETKTQIKNLSLKLGFRQ